MAHSQRKRQTLPLPSGPVSAWDLLRDALNVTTKRPEGSVTPDELAERMGVTSSRARQILVRTKGLAPVKFRIPGGRQSVCYVAK